MNFTRAAVGGLGLATVLAVGLTTIAPAAAGTSGDEAKVTSRADYAAYGLTDNGRLVWFETRFPRDIEVVGALTGWDDDTASIGMDFRVQDGKLYVVGDAGGIYTVNLSTAALTKVSQLSVAPIGDRFGVDFNPAADRLRVISDTGQNLRHDVNTGTTTNDGALTYPAVPPGDPTPGIDITGAGYTNNDLDATSGTALYVIDAALDQVVLQAPANAGLLSSIGKLGVDADADSPVAFDIYSKLRKGKEKAVDAYGFAVLTVDGKAKGYQINLFNGNAKRIRGFKASLAPVDLAFPLDQR